MLEILYPVIIIDGYDHVVDVSVILTSNPPKYKVYKLKDKELTYMFCSELALFQAIRYMHAHDFREWLNGKLVLQTDQVGNCTISTTYYNDINQPIEPKFANIEVSKAVPIPNVSVTSDKESSPYTVSNIKTQITNIIKQIEKQKPFIGIPEKDYYRGSMGRLDVGFRGSIW